jgi:COP9 signalosome complex subunit 1
MDQEWVVATEASNRNARHVLQGRLSTAQSHLHKEAIRTAYIALAQHDLKTGELRDALSSLLRATDYCTTRSQTAPISLMILELSFGLEEYGHVREYVTKVEHTLGAANSTTTASNTTPTAASPSPTASLQDVSIKPNLTTSTTSSSAKMAWSGVTCAEDIALYASLLSLATQDRSSILELAEHPEALELVPAMKDLLSQWSRANYATCLQAFSDSDVGKFVPVGDLYLSGPRWKALSQKIREKCLMEYLRPYQCVRLDSMSQLFPSIHNLQDTLVDLMGRGLIPNAKMDARANVLYKTEPKPSVELAAMEQRVLDDTHAMLIRLGCLEYDLSVQDAVPRGRRAAVAAAAAARYDDESSDDEGDTPMLDADPQNSAANPEDLY